MTRRKRDAGAGSEGVEEGPDAPPLAGGVVGGDSRRVSKHVHFSLFFISTETTPLLCVSTAAHSLGSASSVAHAHNAPCFPREHRRLDACAQRPMLRFGGRRTRRLRITPAASRGPALVWRVRITPLPVCFPPSGLGSFNCLPSLGTSFKLGVSHSLPWRSFPQWGCGERLPGWEGSVGVCERVPLCACLSVGHVYVCLSVSVCPCVCVCVHVHVQRGCTRLCAHIGP